MLLLLRRLKHALLMSSSFRKYAAYAFGELLLIVVGILIALQIDNWNDDRKDRATLQSYLESIARNMNDDLSELAPLREHRLKARYAAAMFTYLRNRDRLEVDAVEFLNEVIELCTLEKYFSANTSGFEALKNSGVLDRLQGSRAERLLSRYYDEVNQIALLEQGLYDLVRPLYISLSNEQIPSGVEEWAFLIPSSLPPARFEELQPVFAQTANSPTMLALARSQSVNHLLMLHYDSLRVLGRAFTQIAETGQLGGSEPIPRTPLDDWNANLGEPNVVTDGRPALGVYSLGASSDKSSLIQFDSIQLRETEIRFEFPGGANWAAFYFLSAGQVTAGSPTVDFSAFSKLHLELKGDRGNEVVRAHIKDIDYPVISAPISVALTLSDKWQSYEIDLSSFEPIDLKRINLALAFAIEPAERPVAFSVRNARFE
jgi:hypothetical protein